MVIKIGGRYMNDRGELCWVLDLEHAEFTGVVRVNNVWRRTSWDSDGRGVHQSLVEEIPLDGSSPTAGLLPLGIDDVCRDDHGGVCVIMKVRRDGSHEGVRIFDGGAVEKATWNSDGKGVKSNIVSKVYL